MTKDQQDGGISTAIREGLRKVTRQIVEQFHPQKVILFGSYAYGHPTEDSDVDLLVVMETEGNPLYAAAHIAAAVDHPFPLDILVIRPSDLDFAVQEQNIFETEVMNQGIILYEAKDHGVDHQSGRRLVNSATGTSRG
jgi:predicted nucleotidyltransferase